MWISKPTPIASATWTEPAPVPLAPETTSPHSLDLLWAVLLSLTMFICPRRSGRRALRLPLAMAVFVAVLNGVALGAALRYVAALPNMKEILLYPGVFFAVCAVGYFILLFFVVLPFVPRPGSNLRCLRHVLRGVLLGSSLIWLLGLGAALLYGLAKGGVLTDIFDLVPAGVGLAAILTAYAAWCIIRATALEYRRAVDLPAPPEPRCDVCGYDLRGTDEAGVCPECGRSVRESMGPGTRPGTPWERAPHFKVSVVLRQMAAVAWRPRRLFADMPVRSGQTAARQWLTISAVLVAICAAPMLPAMALTGTSLLAGMDFSRWPIYAICLATGIVWAFLGLMMVGVETLGLVIVSRWRSEHLMLSTAAKVTSYASTLLLPWVLISVLYFVAATVGYDMDWMRTGPLARWRDHLFVLSSAGAQIVGLFWFEWTVYRGLAKVEFANS